MTEDAPEYGNSPSDHILNPEPPRKLTDREIAKILGGIVGGLLIQQEGDRLVAWCEPQDVCTALEFLLIHWPEYEALVAAMKARERT